MGGKQFVSRVKIENYKCIRSVEIGLSPGINVVVGKNNAGKSALLEALSLDFDSARHRGTSDHITSDDSQAIVEITALDYDLMAEWRGETPMPEAEFRRGIGLTSNQLIVDWLTNQSVHRFEGVCSWNRNWRRSPFPTVSSYPVEREGATYTAIQWDIDAAGRRVFNSVARVSRHSEHLGKVEFERLHQLTFIFRPDDIVSKPSSVSENGTIDQNGKNLAGVIQYLEGQRRLSSYLTLVQEVFPEIRHISTVAKGNALEVRLWKSDDDSDPEILLSQSGRGLAPVLTILYVLSTESRPCRILIDEPQAFLHPDALRRLLRVFRRYEQHQFILATHSPLVVAAAGVATCTLVRQENGESVVQQVDAKSMAGIRQMLLEVGASLHDVFGAERILWVEGQTEVLCFQKMMQADPTLPQEGIVLLPMTSTDMLRRKKHGRQTLDVYDRLCAGNALVAPALGFQFDREQFNESDRLELKKRTNGRCYFTNRCMYENYLLHEDAIADVLAGQYGVGLTVAEVKGLFDEEEHKSGPDWKTNAEGVKVLQKVFRQLASVEYQKTLHSPMLTEWLLINAPQELAELKELLHQMLNPAEKSSPRG